VRGFLLGGCVSVAFVATILANPDVWSDPYDEDSGTALGVFMGWSALDMPPLGYLAAIVFTVRRSTRRLGQGMLSGLTLTLPIAVALLFGFFVSRSL
jgi:hypothetical protein